MIFGAWDVDHSGSLSKAEVVAGLSNLRRMTITEERTRLFMQKGLKNMVDDHDSVPQFAVAAFLIRGPSQRKLMRAGIDPQDTRRLLQELQGSVMAKDRRRNLDLKARFLLDDVIKMIMDLRRPRPVERWRIVVKQIFEEADRDCSGFVDYSEFLRLLKSPQAKKRCQAAGIDLQRLFHSFYLSGNSEKGSPDERQISQEELMKAVEEMLEACGHPDLQHGSLARQHRRSLMALFSLTAISRKKR